LYPRFSCLSVLFFLAAFQTSTGDYLQQRKIVLLDHTPPSSGLNNFLFRGNEPKILVNQTDVFAYDLLLQFMKNASRIVGLTLPSDFYLMDLKQVYAHEFGRDDIVLEKTFFEKNPSLGELGLNITSGDLFSPQIIPTKERLQLARSLPTWQHDNLPARIPWLRSLLFARYPKPLVIYVHCECGCDRTGEIAGSYAMRYLNMSYPKVLGWDDAIAGRPIMPEHAWAIHWYCYFLMGVEGIDGLLC